MSKCEQFGHPVMDVETGLCVVCGGPMDCPPIIDFGVGDKFQPAHNYIECGCPTCAPKPAPLRRRFRVAPEPAPNPERGERGEGKA